VKNPLKRGGEEKMECIGNAVLSRAVGFPRVLEIYKEVNL
jgi:hypothetical protein